MHCVIILKSFLVVRRMGKIRYCTHTAKCTRNTRTKCTIHFRFLLSLSLSGQTEMAVVSGFVLGLAGLPLFSQTQLSDKTLNDSADGGQTVIWFLVGNVATTVP